MPILHFGYNFRRNIRPYVSAELKAASSLNAQGHAKPAFTHLERAHVLGQASTIHHVRVHWRMLLWGVQQRDLKECIGQLFRIVGAATKTAFGFIPHGNTGGANVSPFKPMPVPVELEIKIQQAHRTS